MSYRIGIIEDDFECRTELMRCVEECGWSPVPFENLSDFEKQKDTVDAVIADMASGDNNIIRVSRLLRSVYRMEKGIGLFTFVGMPAPEAGKCAIFVKNVFYYGYEGNNDARTDYPAASLKDSIEFFFGEL